MSEHDKKDRESRVVAERHWKDGGLGAWGHVREWMWWSCMEVGVRAEDMEQEYGGRVRGRCSPIVCS